MITCRANFPLYPSLPSFRSVKSHRLGALLVCLLILTGVAYAQDAHRQEDGSEAVVVSGVLDTDAYGLGQTVRVSGTVKQGAMSFGGDVIVEGVVEGDVATIGGSVIQLPGARIGGDVIVIGGTYYPSDAKPLRKPGAVTIMYAGYQPELRELMRNPLGIIRPRWTPGYLGTRFLVILFWFVVSLAFTAAMPQTISRGIARLKLTSLRVALIGLIGVVVFGAGPILCLYILPQPLSVLIGLISLLLWLVSGLFGRVILYAATGRWLQNKYFPIARHSEAVALLLGTSFWVLLTSLPYVWPFIATVILVLSLGLTLTSRYRTSWQRSPQSSPVF